MHYLSQAICLAVTVSSLATGCRPGAVETPTAPDRAAIRVELMDADRAFASATSLRGLDGWMASFAVDAIRFNARGEAVQGAREIRAADSAFISNPARLLTWEPTDAGAFDGGDLGFTRGRYAVLSRPEGDTLSTGGYFTFWRRDAQGWRAIFDTGNPDPPIAR